MRDHSRTEGRNLQRPGLIVLCTHGIGDPLVESLVLDYLRRLQADPEAGEVLLITEEPPGSPSPRMRSADLARERITWMPLRYDLGGWQWLQRLRNIRKALRASRAFARSHPRAWVVGHLAFAGAYGVIISWLIGCRLLVLCFEPHSRYMIELGIWGRWSLKALVTGCLERLQMTRSEAIIVPTTAVRDLVLEHRRPGGVELQGITIDTKAHGFDADARRRLRASHGLADGDLVFVYAGKFGGIYHSVGDFLSFIHALYEADAGVRWCVVAQPSELERIREHGLWPGLAAKAVLQPQVPAAELHQWLSMADVGVVAIPPTPAQAFRTPVKTAHYWAAGLPVVIPRGVSDDHAIAEAERVGVAVADLPGIDAAALLDQVRSLFTDGADACRDRCRDAALRHRDSTGMAALLRRILVA